jgi:hypothetical protein
VDGLVDGGLVDLDPVLPRRPVDRVRVLGATPAVRHLNLSPVVEAEFGGYVAGPPRTSTEVVVAALLDVDRPDLAAMVTEVDGRPQMVAPYAMHEPDLSLVERAFVIGMAFDLLAGS